MVDLAAELGPFSHNLINTVNESIDRILAHQHLNTEGKVIKINEFTTSGRKWAASIFKTPAVIKIVKGTPVVIKAYIPAPVELVLRAIVPKIMEREDMEQEIADADNSYYSQEEDHEMTMTLSEHELDSGNISALPRDDLE